jgi:hypothetical protein
VFSDFIFYGRCSWFAFGFCVAIVSRSPTSDTGNDRQPAAAADSVLSIQSGIITSLVGKARVDDNPIYINI